MESVLHGLECKLPLQALQAVESSGMALAKAPAAQGRAGWTVSQGGEETAGRGALGVPSAAVLDTVRRD